jgi:hypothetical protein
VLLEAGLGELASVEVAGLAVDHPTSQAGCRPTARYEPFGHRWHPNSNPVGEFPSRSTCDLQILDSEFAFGMP